MRKQIVLFQILVLSIFLCGCGLFRSAGQGTSALFNKMLTHDAKRQSSLDRIEEEEKEYLLDTVLGGNAKRPTQLAGQNEGEAWRIKAEADLVFQQAAAGSSQTEEGLSEDRSTLLVKAAGLYEQAASLWINSTLEQDALYKAGEAYFLADHYKKANDVFERLVKHYDGTRYADAIHARRFSIAKYWLELSKQQPQNPLVLNWSDQQRPMRDTTGNAVRILNRIRLDHPTGKIADDATLALANVYFEQKKYLDAADTYEDLRVNFPNSEHQFHAHLFELKSRLESYQGPHYDGTHLDTAEKLGKAMVSQFPQQSSEHREMITRELARIRKMKAEREMALAAYYEARGAYQAAGLHYQQVQSAYQNTPLADDASKRLAEIAEKPTTSQELPSWVARLFPEPKPSEPLLGTSLKDQLR